MTLSEPSPDSFGSKLREAREQRGTSLRQIADATRISIGALEALERDDISRLPGGIFTRAFVRSYAVEVGLDPEHTIREFLAYYPQESVTAGHPGSVRVDDTDPSETRRQAAWVSAKLAAISIPIVAAMFYFGVGRGGAPRSSPAQIENAPAVPAVAIPQGGTAAGGAPPAGTVPIGAAQEPAATQPGDVSPAGLTVGLSVRERCWLSVLVDGERAIQRQLEPGESQTFEVHNELVITAGNAGAVVLMLNGLEARPLGRPGEVVTKRLNLTNFKTYLTSP